jgi:hypothetical protein
MEMKLSALVVIGIVMASTMMAFIPTTSAINWGITKIINVDQSAYHLTRFEMTAEAITITVKYENFYPAYFPAMITLEVEECPTWLTASLTRYTLVIKPGESDTTGLNLVVSQHDVEAGSNENVVILAKGELLIPFGRTLWEDRTSISVTYNPFTEISVSVASPIGEAAPDTRLRFPVKVTNLGNSPVTVKLGAIEEPGGWRYVVSPTIIKIPPKAVGEETYPHEYAYLTLESPHGTAISYHNSWEGATIKAEAKSNSDTYILEGGKWVKHSEPIDGETYYTDIQTMLCKNKGFYVPGFDILPLIAAIGIVLVLIRKRK